MFSMFESRRKRSLHTFLARLVSRSDPTLVTRGSEYRRDRRYDRTLAVLLAPCEKDSPLLGSAICGVTKNVSSDGLAVLVSNEPFDSSQVAVGFWVEDRGSIALGEIKSNTALGGGFWQLGIELTELIESAEDAAMSGFLSITDFLKPLELEQV